MDKCLICQICGKELPFNPKCPCTLGGHMLRKHPQVIMTHFSKENLLCCCSSTRSSENKFKHPCPKTGLPCRCAINEPPPSINKKIRPRCKFETSVETWKPGPLRVICPHCFNIDRPCIRIQRNRVAYSPLGALCLLVCWPICFMPFMMSQTQISLFCKKCGAFLGEYDQKSGHMKCPPCAAQGDINVPSEC
ncbi:hypothetical protein ABEB36_000671 [Hypothenemus hampei]|uniref:LITAF domain-containing protein n=1 Tax=Hypothenemus hampei TaxID=57062 RepID=A0ABD1FEN9_HYPHA